MNFKTVAAKPCTGYIPGHIVEAVLDQNAQARAIKNYRRRVTERGLARFEVLGLDADRAMIRSPARRLAEDGPDAERIRTAVDKAISGAEPKRGGIVDALRRSPLVGIDLEIKRST